MGTTGVPHALALAHAPHRAAPHHSVHAHSAREPSRSQYNHDMFGKTRCGVLNEITDFMGVVVCTAACCGGLRPADWWTRDGKKKEEEPAPGAWDPSESEKLFFVEEGPEEKPWDWDFWEKYMTNDHEKAVRNEL